jgi:uncharacterized membrane protein
MPFALAAFSLGFVAGLRAMTPPAVLRLVRDGNKAAYLAALGALGEYAADLAPNAPARTQPGALLARAWSGAYCGRRLAPSSDRLIAGMALGAVGAIAGAFGGLAVRRRAMELVGPVPAALLEDAVAIAAAVLIVTQSR